MMTDDQIIEVVKAHKEGKVIQWCNADKNDWADYQVCSFKDSGLNFDFMHYDYRIKPEPKLRPYKSVEEFLTAQKEHGPNIIEDDWFGIPLSGRNYGEDTKIFLYNEIGKSFTAVSFKVICNKPYKWQDGTPCGIIEEN